ncbi:Hypothetical_protein [Hexamita inflata]|uniref:Hypothetical_protein n=1 Tax=Hexamita inflata TaxID=28002 RepID=A0AA86NFJ2_9EUKA|nr:Hypothetical protein HINF_LOCUS5870 [Hexamita inflata]
MSTSSLSFTRYEDYAICCIHDSNLGAHFGQSFNQQISLVLQKMLDYVRKESLGNKPYNTLGVKQKIVKPNFDSQVFNLFLTKFYRSSMVNIVQNLLNQMRSQTTIIFAQRYNLDILTNNVSTKMNEFVIKNLVSQMEDLRIHSMQINERARIIYLKRYKDFQILSEEDTKELDEQVNCVLKLVGFYE